MYIYVICPVRLSTPDTIRESEEYVKRMEQEGHTLFFPHRDIDQANTSVAQIVQAEIEAIKRSDEVHIFWDKTSRGSHFDLGAALALNKPIRLVRSFHEDGPEKSYEKVIRSKER